MTTILANSKRSAFLRLVLLSLALAAAAGIIWNVFHETSALQADTKGNHMSVNKGPQGNAGDKAAGVGGGSSSSGPSGPSANGSTSGSTPLAGPIDPRKKKPGPLALIPPASTHHDGQVPDGSPASAIPEPADLSLLAGPQELPQRRPLINPTVATAGAYGQITG